MKRNFLVFHGFGQKLRWYEQFGSCSLWFISVQSVCLCPVRPTSFLDFFLNITSLIHINLTPRGTSMPSVASSLSSIHSPLIVWRLEGYWGQMQGSNSKFTFYQFCPQRNSCIIWSPPFTSQASPFLFSSRDLLSCSFEPQRWLR